MRNKTTTILIACLLVLWCGQALAAGALAVDQKLLALGILTEGDKAKRTVTLTNKGKAPLHIDNVSTSCSCTTTTLGKTDLKPGESTSLEIVYDTYKFPGKFEKYVTVAWAGEKSKLVVTLVGDVTPIPMGVLDVAPRKISAGDMAVGAPVKLRLVVKNTGDAAMKVEKVEAQKAGLVFFDAAKDGAASLAPGQEWSLDFNVSAATPGTYVEYLLVHSDARNVTDKGYKVVIVGSAK
jgi:hypothetical protein